MTHASILNFVRLTVGTGAVGAIYSWRLSKSCNVTAVCRSNYDIVKEQGFTIESAKFGNENFKPHHGKVFLYLTKQKLYI